MNERLGKVPLERALSKLGVASRAQTREWILSGKLLVNGKVVKDPWFPVVPETDQFVVDGKPMTKSAWCTVMMYKPKGIVTTKSDEKGRATVFDLLPAEMKTLHPVGRLDMASTGLLILTNDTRLSDFLTDPTNAIPRTYVVTIEGQLLDAELEQIVNGIMDEGELLKPSKLTLKKASRKESHFLVELTEGKNRELRRIFSFFGHRVRRLKRIAFGPLELGDLEPGTFRPLTESEITALAALCSSGQGALGLRRNRENI
ncbi:MAG: rRNA pseudouridine synthase [Candidatus Omnitrophica bacterium]|nr:rRNA pseudouridine synthase [Candidatus Omnitrophota bacterium]